MSAVSETEKCNSKDSIPIVDWLQNLPERGLETREED